MKYSLRTKFVGKKQQMSYLLLLVFPILLITIGGYLAIEFLQDEFLNDTDIADVIYIYPSGNTASVLEQSVTNAVVIDEYEIGKILQADDDQTELLIDLDSKELLTDFDLGYQEQQLIESLVQETQLAQLVSDLDKQEQSKYYDASENFETKNVLDDENDNNDILYGISFVNTLLIYFIIIFGFQMLGSEIFEEKSSRAMEVIITNTKPQVHMLVKICSTLIFLLSLIVTVILGILIGVFMLAKLSPETVGMIIDLLTEFLTNLNIAIDSSLVIFITLTIITGLLAVLLFQIIGAVAAAMTTSYEDYQKANAPIVITVLIPYFISMFNVTILAKILVYIPFFTPFFAPSLYLNGDITLLNFGLCIIIQVIVVVILYKVCAPIYREGLLNYSTSSFKEIIKRSRLNN